MNSSKTLSMTLVAASMLAGCASGFNATYDHDPQQDFSGYKSYSWISATPMKVGPSVQAPSPLLEGRVMRVVEATLEVKGYERVDDPANADFAVSFTVGSREQIRVDAYPSMSLGYSSGYPSHWRWGAAYHCCATETKVRQYTTGVLAIDMFDVEQKRPVWHGVASKRVSEKDRKDIDATVRAAVDAILAGFPPG